MALVLEDGTGVDGANTYQSLASISSYCSDMGYTSWASLSTTAQTSAIYRGMSYIEAKNYKGSKVDQDNPLKFPRTNLRDQDGRLISTTKIPRNLKKAEAEAAYREGTNSGTLEPDITQGSGAVEMEKIGPITTKYFDRATKRKRFTIIDGLLSPFTFSKFSIPLALG